MDKKLPSVAPFRPRLIPNGRPTKGLSINRLHIALLLTAFLSGCATPPPLVTPRMLHFAPPKEDMEGLEAGRQIYISRCAKCHALDSPSTYSPSEWKRIVPKMAEPAKLLKQQETVLLNYLLAANAQIKADATAH